MNDSLNTIYILSKGRPKNKSSDYLKSIDYPYWYVVIQDDEEYREEYHSNYGENVLEFHHADYCNFDTYDHYGDSMTTGPVPVRNFIIDHGKKNKLKRVWELDDDVKSFSFFKQYNYKYELTTAEEVYECLNIFSTLADTIKAESISFKDGVFLSYDKKGVSKLKNKVNCIMMSINTDTKYYFINRGLSDLSRSLKLIRYGKFSLEVQCVVNNTRHAKHGGMADDRVYLSLDATIANALKDEPLMWMEAKKSADNKLYLAAKHYTTSMTPKILRQEYS